MTSVAPNRLADDVMLQLSPDEEKAEGIRVLEQLLPATQERYDRAFALRIQKTQELCDAAEELSVAHAKLENAKRKLRAAGIAVQPTKTFASAQAQSTDEGWELRKLLYRTQESTRGSW